ncbi:MAG: diguanylate cyclase [Acidobacteriota bacterium]|jgi:diguanylate cyclase (GGDEF)-like protein|nr:diguanylate cyclase [Acidobacteriota bacterium]
MQEYEMVSDAKNTVLLVDDESANLLSLNKLLAPDYAVFMAKSGEQALQLVSANKPDIILLDVLMPEMDGFETLARLKADPETKEIPVIIVTGITNESDEITGFALGAADYVKKPFKGEVIRARVSTQVQLLRQMRMNETLIRTDLLTSIPNRRRFNEHLAMEWRRAVRERTPISLLMMDVDQFKVYNDTWGHPQGDILLKTVAAVFSSSINRPSDLVARLGGEEFAVLLPNTELEGARMIAETIRRNVEAVRIPAMHACLTEGKDAGGEEDSGRALTSTTISIGVTCTIPEVTDMIADFIARADANLYIAKESGRNQVCAA